MPRNVFVDISKLEKREKDHIKTVIERAEWIPGQPTRFTLSNCIRAPVEPSTETDRREVRFFSRVDSLSFHSVFAEDLGKNKQPFISPQKPSPRRVNELRSTPNVEKLVRKKLERQRSVSLDDELIPTRRLDSRKLPPQKLFKDPLRPTGALSQEEPRNSLKVGFFPVENGSFSLVIEDCIISSLIKPHLKLKYIPSGKKKRLDPSEMVPLGNGLMKLSFCPVTLKRQLWEGLNYVQIKLKETAVLFSNETCGELLIDASSHAFRNKTVRCFFVQQIKNTFKNYYRGGIEVSARLSVDPDAAQTIILEIVVESVFNLPAGAKLVQVGAMLWPLEESIRFKSEAVQLNEKRRADIGHQFSFHLNSTVYKKNRDMLGIYLEIMEVKLHGGRLQNYEEVGHTRICATDPKSKVFLKKLKNRVGQWHRETFLVTMH